MRPSTTCALDFECDRRRTVGSVDEAEGLAILPRRRNGVIGQQAELQAALPLVDLKIARYGG